MTTPLLADLLQQNIPTGSLAKAARTFLTRHGCPKTAQHSDRVAAEARRLAFRFGEPPDLAEQAGWLHDISAVIPPEMRLQAARQLEVEVLPEEAAFPLILHQKLSVVLAQRVFGISHPAVLSAIGCHTTLKAQASRLDQVVFIADKLEWDAPGPAPYRQELLAALEQSLEQGVRTYLEYLWQQRARLPVIHPWLAAAYRQFSALRTS